MALIWKIESLNCKPSFDGKTNVVETIHWRLNGVDGDYATSVYGSQGVTYEEGSPFTDYDSLVEETVIKWLKDALGEEQVSNYETSVKAQLEVLKNPSVVNPPLPF
jgi:hypothetical protein